MYKQEDTSSITHGRKRKCETNDFGLYKQAMKRLKETNDKLFTIQQLLRQIHRTKVLETIIISDNGVSISQDVEEIINEINKGE